MAKANQSIGSDARERVEKATDEYHKEREARGKKSKR